MTNTANVTVGKPKIGGAISRAPLGAVVPTSSVVALSPEFVGLGYVSEEGLTNANSPETGNIIAWGGDVVYAYQSSKEDTFTFTLIEAMNIEVLKAVYGADNASGTLEEGISIKANSVAHEKAAWVVDMILQGGILKRIVIPNASITELGEIAYQDEDAVGYEVTITAMPDVEGNTHYEYIQKPTE